jgi:Uracil DNA glycosylase superfamily
LGINPGRFGAGVTGVPFTDTKRLTDQCGLKYSGKETHEPSSVFVYEVIDAYGGTSRFYHDFYINSICPLGFTISDGKGKEKNYNYYDSKELTNAVAGFMVESIQKQIEFGIQTDICYCFGTGKNEKFLRLINNENGFFKEIIALEHPRYVMQYKSKLKQQYIDKYIEAFRKVI